MARARTWCFTSYRFNRTVAFIFNEEATVKYILVGNEKATTTERKHWQGHVTFTSGKTMKAAQRVLGLGTPHMEICQCVPKSIIYCKKEGDWVEYGAAPKQGKRSDFDNMKELIDNGCNKGGISEIELWESNFGLMGRYHKAMRRYKFLKETKLARVYRKVQVDVYYGTTGAGKTRKAMGECEYSVHCSGKGKWWDTYEFNMKTVLADEFSNGWPIERTLALMGGNPLILETKGGHTWAGWTRLIITSNLSPWEWHCSAKPKQRAAMFRRVTNWINFDEEEEENDPNDSENDIIMPDVTANKLLLFQDLTK